MNIFSVIGKYIILFFTTVGRYVLFLRKVFSRPDNYYVFYKNIINEMYNLGLSSIGFVAFVSLFVGAVVTLQIAYTLENTLIPSYLKGMATRDSIILEFSPTMISLILAGKMGSNIASTIGTMRVTEQIDALEMMGINSSSYLVFPKIIALIFINPILIIYSMFLAILGGWFFGEISGLCSTAEFLDGVQYYFISFNIYYAFIKTMVFAFIISTLPAYYGFFTKGGALEVGVSSTNGVVNSSILIIIFNYLITQLLLS